MFSDIINTCQNIDCMELFKQIPDESIDCVITDCPYKILAGGTRHNDNYAATDPKGVLNRRAGSGKTATTAAVQQGGMFDCNEIEFSAWVPEIYRVLKPGTHAYLMINGRNLKNLWQVAEDAGFAWQNLLVWDKVGTQTPNKFYMNKAEFCLLLSKRPARNINDMGCSNIFSVRNPRGNKLHPTEKPVELLEQWVLNSTQPGEIILEPFAGSGAVCVAAQKWNRQFVASEIDAEYHKVTVGRLQEKESSPSPVEGTLF